MSMVDNLAEDRAVINSFIANLKESAFDRSRYLRNRGTSHSTKAEREMLDDVSRQTTGEQIALHGAMTAIAALVEYDIYACLRFAADLLEDVNAHKEAGVLREYVAELEKDTEDYCVEIGILKSANP